MKIGVDFDGVCSDCGQLKSDAALELYGLVIPPEKFKKELVVGGGILTLEQYHSLQKTIYGTREYGLRMQMVANARARMNRLRARGHTISCVTSRSGPELVIAEEWAGLKGLGLSFTGVGYGISKAAACQGLDVYIDDDLDKLEPLQEIVPHRFLFSWGYNAHIDAGSVARRVSSWGEFDDAIQQLEGR